MSSLTSVTASAAQSCNPFSASSSSTSDPTLFLAALQSSVAPAGGAGATNAGSGTDPFQSLASDLQAMLVQLQSGLSGAGPATGAGTASTTASATTGTGDTTSADAATTRPHHHHHHHGGAGGPGGPGQLQQDASRLLADLDAMTGTGATSAPAATSSAPAAAPVLQA